MRLWGWFLIFLAARGFSVDPSYRPVVADNRDVYRPPKNLSFIARQVIHHKVNGLLNILNVLGGIDTDLTLHTHGSSDGFEGSGGFTRDKLCNQIRSDAGTPHNAESCARWLGRKITSSSIIGKLGKVNRRCSGRIKIDKSSNDDALICSSLHLQSLFRLSMEPIVGSSYPYRRKSERVPLLRRVIHSASDSFAVPQPAASNTDDGVASFVKQCVSAKANDFASVIVKDVQMEVYVAALCSDNDIIAVGGNNENHQTPTLSLGPQGDGENQCDYRVGRDAPHAFLTMSLDGGCINTGKQIFQTKDGVCWKIALSNSRCRRELLIIPAEHYTLP